MKLIIDIPEWLYDSISEYPSRGFAVSQLESAILHGTLIPDNETVCDIEQIKDVQKWEREIGRAEALEQIGNEVKLLKPYNSHIDGLIKKSDVLQIIAKYTK